MSDFRPEEISPGETPVDDEALPDNELRRAFEAYSEGAEPQAECPAPEKIWAAVNGELSGEERRALILHTASCGSCAEDWRLARACLDDDSALSIPMSPGLAPSLAPGAGVLGGAERFQRLRTWALAAAAVLVLALGLAVFVLSGPQMPSSDPVYRSAEGVEIRSNLPADQPLFRTSARLSWTPAEGARYHLLVMTADFQTVYEVHDLTESEATVPAEAFSSLPAGTELLWRVAVLGTEGESLASETFSVRLE